MVWLAAGTTTRSQYDHPSAYELTSNFSVLMGTDSTTQFCACLWAVAGQASLTLQLHFKLQSGSDSYRRLDHWICFLDLDIWLGFVDPVGSRRYALPNLRSMPTVVWNCFVLCCLTFCWNRLLSVKCYRGFNRSWSQSDYILSCSWWLRTNEKAMKPSRPILLITRHSLHFEVRPTQPLLMTSVHTPVAVKDLFSLITDRKWPYGESDFSRPTLNCHVCTWTGLPISFRIF